MTIRSKFPNTLDRVDGNGAEWGYICKGCIKELNVPKNMLTKPRDKRFSYCSVFGCKGSGDRFITFNWKSRHRNQYTGLTCHFPEGKDRWKLRVSLDCIFN